MPNFYAYSAPNVSRRVKLAYVHDLGGVPRQIKAAYAYDANGLPRKVFPQTLAYAVGLAGSTSTAKKPGFIWDSSEPSGVRYTATFIAATDIGDVGYRAGDMGTLVNVSPDPWSAFVGLWTSGGELVLAISGAQLNPYTAFDALTIGENHVVDFANHISYLYSAGNNIWRWNFWQNYDPETGAYLGNTSAPLALVSGQKYPMSLIVP